MSGPVNHELARQDAVLGERLNTTPAEYKTDIGWLAEQMAKSDSHLLLFIAVLLAMAIYVLLAVANSVNKP